MCLSVFEIPPYLSVSMMSEDCSLLTVSAGKEQGVAKWDVLTSGLTNRQTVSTPLPLRPTASPPSSIKCLLIYAW